MTAAPNNAVTFLGPGSPTSHNSNLKQFMTRKERFIVLYQPVSERIERFALYLERNREEAKELLSETLAAAYEHLDDLRSDQAFLGWLFSICYRRHKSRRRKQSQRVTLESLDDLLGPDGGEYSSYDIELLYRAINRLPEKEREAVLMAEVFGFAHKEIAEIQQTTAFNVKTRVYRAKKALREMFAEDNPSSNNTRYFKPSTIL